MSNWLDDIKWDSDGLIPAIAQDYKTDRVLMVAWLNRESLELTVKEQRAVYWSRSRQKNSGAKVKNQDTFSSCMKCASIAMQMLLFCG